MCVTRWISTSTLNAPNRYADHLLHTRSALMPSPETRKVHATKSSSVTTISGVLLRTPKSRSSTDSIA